MSKPLGPRKSKKVTPKKKKIMTQSGASTKKADPSNYPFEDGQPFIIRTGMASQRSIHVAEHIGGHQYIVRLRDYDPSSNDQQFVFDSRTKSIRQNKRRNFALGLRAGMGLQTGGSNYVVVREFQGQSQTWRYQPGRSGNLRNEADKCLDVVYGKDTPNNHMCTWVCHGHLNQGWTLHKIPEFKPNYPLDNKVVFHIRTGMNSKRAIEVKEHVGANQYILRMADYDPIEENQQFMFDSRTKSIRQAHKKNFALGTRLGYGY